MGEVNKEMWAPPTKDTNMSRFMEKINAKHALALDNYEALYNWSIEHHDVFWEEVWNFAEIKHSTGYSQVLDTTRSIQSIPEWFCGARLNFAENLLRFNDDHEAVHFIGEDRSTKSLTYAELREQVAKCYSALKELGVGVGDRVAAYIPNCVEAIVGMLATTALGGIWSSTSPDFGVQAVLDRFTQIEPKVLFTVNAVRYNGKVHDHLCKAKEVASGMKELLKVVVIPFVEDKATGDIEKSVTWASFLTASAQPLVFEQLPFNHPAYIMFSSGTTGLPKCIVHSAGGTLIQHMKEHMLHGDMCRDDRLIYYTTTGWMMWNWMVSALGVGCTVVLYDGSPFHPSPTGMWDIVDSARITMFGTSAKYLASCEEHNVKPMETHSLKTLRCILSTGSVLKDASYEYVYTQIKKDVLLASISGGTDIISCFCGGNPMRPVYRGEVQSRNLGMGVEAFGPDGRPTYDDRGELICKKPFPSMPVSFWNDADGSKYKKAYFSGFDNVWTHGDFIIINSVTKGLRFLGRSDATLNPAGIRFGSSEIYHVVEGFPVIEDSVCIGQQMGVDERVVLFVKMQKGQSFSQELVDTLKKAIRSSLSARHVPAVIMPIDDIPYTMNGKKVELAVKEVVHGLPIHNKGALRNPESLDLFKGIL